MDTRLDRIAKLAGIVGEVAKIVAIIVGGTWILFNFVFVDGPERFAALSPSLSLRVETDRDTTVCRLVISASLSNGSRQTVQVTSLNLRLWTHTVPSSVGSIQLLSWEDVEDEPVDWALPERQWRFFARTYEPGQSASNSYTLRVPKAVGELVYVKLTITSPDTSLQEEVGASRTEALACDP